MTEFTQKQDRIKALLAESHLDALLLQRVSSFAWATCGASSYVNTATTDGAASLLVTPAGRYLFTTNIEATRIEQEEKLVEQGWEFRAAPWHANNDAVAQLTRGLKLGAMDRTPARSIYRVRSRDSASICCPKKASGSAHWAACAPRRWMVRCAPSTPARPSIKSQDCWLTRRKAVARNLSSTSSPPTSAFSNSAIRCPPTKSSNVTRCWCLCGRKWGLVCSITRFVHFGKLSDEVRRKTEATAQMDATFIAATRPGQIARTNL